MQQSWQLRQNRFALLALPLLAIGAIMIPDTVRAGNWPQWRGPQGTSVSQETGLPLTWSEEQNIRWKTPLPEWGTSTPAIWEDAVFVTTESDRKLLLLRIDKRTGEIVWTRQVGQGAANRQEPGGGKRTSKFHQLHNLASPSPVTDGQHVIVHFGSGDLACYSFDGRLNWKRNLAEEHGQYTIWWGHANSPVFYNDLVISVCMQDSMEGEWEQLSPSYLVAHKVRTGKPVWKSLRMTEADAEQCDSYTTPIFHQAGDRLEMVVMGGNQLDAYDPATGRQLWHLPGLVGGRTITGPTVGHGLIYTTVGMRGEFQAIRPTGQGRISLEEAILWKEERSTPDTCCPVLWNDLAFVITDNGIASCFDATTGELKWRERIQGGNFKSSPLAADGRIYFLSRNGWCTVVKASPEFQVLAENKLEDEFLASPAVSDGRLYLRGRKSLYAIGN